MQPCNDSESLDICLTRRHSELCSIFSSPIRIDIMFLLGHGEKTVGELAEALGNIAPPNLSQHLRVMRDQAAVRTRKDGRNVFYRIANPNYLEALKLTRAGLLEEIQKNHQAAAENRFSQS